MLKKILIIGYNVIRFIGKKSYKNILFVSPSTKIAIDKSAYCLVDNNFRTRNNVEINVREKAKLIIDDNVFINSNTIITCRDKIYIGKNTIIAPNVMIFDHDHKIKNGRVLHNDYELDEIIIGENVWIGAGSIILRGSKIGDNSIIAAQSVVKGEIPSNTIYIQSRNLNLKDINERRYIFEV
ncbi:acyltransferase [Thomasclavelia cocleata]|uniref:acyltransferase n=3 Tax=Thomasclavelia cocleata TaxID=69824 RepID=UPI002431DE93|nr:acyltransferase [Thomasclavelia cocleata]